MKGSEHIRNLVVVTKNFGTNFTGATLATATYVRMLQHDFASINIWCVNEGNHEVTQAAITRFSGAMSLLRHLTGLRKKPDTLYLSDDHFGVLLALAGVPYTHFYHGNWPDAMTVSPAMFLKSFFFIPAYSLTMARAKSVIHVSHYMEGKFRFLNSNTYLVRNGVQVPTQVSRTDKPEVLRVLMTGNIDNRKYGLAPWLFQLIQKGLDTKGISIDIFGKVVDLTLAKELERFPFVKLKGYNPGVPFGNYDVFLSLSRSENLPIAICEALAARVPVICFNVGGNQEVVKSGENGFVVPGRRLDKIVAFLKQMQSSEITFRFEDHVLAEFDWSRSYARLRNILFGTEQKL